LVSGFRPAAGQKKGRSNRKKKLMNIERRMNVFCLF
jgi:hypothetical protein